MIAGIAGWIFLAGVTYAQVDSLKTRVGDLEKDADSVITHTAEIKHIEEKYEDISDKVEKNTQAQVDLITQQAILVDRLNRVLNHIEPEHP